jgi:hypothetical protein
LARALTRDGFAAGLLAAAFLTLFAGRTLMAFLTVAAFFLATIFLGEAITFLDLAAALTDLEATETFLGLAGFFEADFLAFVVRPFSIARERLLAAFVVRLRIVTSVLKMG